MSEAVQQPGSGMWMKGLGIALIAAAGFAGGNYFASGKVTGEAVASAEGQPAKPVNKTVTSTTTLPGNRINAFGAANPPLPGIDGEEHSLDEWKGKVIMLNFWATWCPPCQYEIPDFIRFQREHGAEGLQIVGIGIDEQRKLKNFSRTMEMNYPVLASAPEKSGELLNEWGNTEQILPYTVIIDRDGRIAYIQRGEFTEAAFNEFVKPLLAN